MHLLLDSGPLGLITHPKGGPDAVECVDWFARLLQAGATIYVPEIIDYELRRELLRTHLKGGDRAGLTKLDALVTGRSYLPLTTAVMRRAAALWAQARNQGKPAARDEALDADMILSAQRSNSGNPSARPPSSPPPTRST